MVFCQRSWWTFFGATICCFGCLAWDLLISPNSVASFKSRHSICEVFLDYSGFWSFISKSSIIVTQNSLWSFYVMREVIIFDESLLVVLKVVFYKKCSDFKFAPALMHFFNWFTKHWYTTENTITSKDLKARFVH